jgi:hypothetical protein
MIEYNQGPPPPRDRYSDRPPAPAVDDRLDQARKVQQVSPTLLSGVMELMRSYWLTLVMPPLKRMIIHHTHLLVKGHPRLDMDHLLQTTTHLPLLLLLHTRTRDTATYQLDPRLRIIVHHHQRHLTFLHRVDMPLLPITLRQVEVGITPIQLQHRVTEVLHPRIPLLAMEHHPLIPLMETPITINPLPRHITLIQDTTHLPTMDTIPLLPEATLNPPHKGTHNLLLRLMIQPHKVTGRMYLLLLIHDDHLLLRRDRGSIDHHLKGRDRVVKLGICWLGLYVPLSFAVMRWLMDRIRTDNERTMRRRN